MANTEKYAVAQATLCDQDWKTQLALKYPNIPIGTKVKVIQEDYYNFYGGPWTRVSYNDNYYWVNPDDIKMC